MAKLPSQRKGAPTAAKARKILSDRSVRGKPLTKRQRGFFGAVAGKQKRR